jgi:hypothetical protein
MKDKTKNRLGLAIPCYGLYKILNGDHECYTNSRENMGEPLFWNFYQVIVSGAIAIDLIIQATKSLESILK